MNTLARWHSPGPAFWTRWIARGLVLAWALFWIWFNLASGVSEVRAHGLSALAFHTGFAAVIVALGYTAWRWELAGGILLIAAAVACDFLFYSAKWFGPWWPVPLLLLGPPVLAGLLLIVRGTLFDKG